MQPLEEDGYFTIAVKDVANEVHEKTLDLYETNNLLCSLLDKHRGDVTAVTNAWAEHFQEVLKLDEKPSHRLTSRLADQIFAAVAAQKKADAGETMPGSPASTQASTSSP